MGLALIPARGLGRGCPCLASLRSPWLSHRCAPALRPGLCMATSFHHLHRLEQAQAFWAARRDPGHGSTALSFPGI